MKTKICLLTSFLLLGFSYFAYAQTWTNVSPGWGVTNGVAEGNSMAVYGGNLYVGTLNNGGAQVWQYNGTAWKNVSPGWAAANTVGWSMTVYGGNLYVGTLNNGGAQVWQYDGIAWINVSPAWAACC
jgi:hypothetical protein